MRNRGPWRGTVARRRLPSLADGVKANGGRVGIAGGNHGNGRCRGRQVERVIQVWHRLEAEAGLFVPHVHDRARQLPGGSDLEPAWLVAPGDRGLAVPTAVA